MRRFRRRGGGAVAPSVPALGPRGEGWVVLQLLCLVAVAAVGLLAPGWPAAAAWWSVVGVLTAAAGGLLAALGLRRLGPSLTAVPRPHETAELRAGGVYARARHPIYGGLLLVALGFALLTSPWALVPWGVLVGVLTAKSIREEGWLVERYPAYAEYRTRVRRRFVPFLV
jgi:protein-S-isoprenylcysteine O-methyltransferase Ste14